MGIGAAIVGGISSIAGGVISGSASQSAADTQSQAAEYSANIQAQMYNQTRNDLSPFVQAGQGALSNYASLLPGGLNLAPAQPSSLAGGTQGTGGGGTGTANIPGVGQVALPGVAGGNSLTAPTTSSSPVAPASALTNLEALAPGSANASPGQPSVLTALQDLTPGAKNPSPLMNSVYNFVPGASGTPNSALTGLEGLTPGGPAGSQNPLLTQLNNLLGVGGAAGSGGGAVDPAAVQAALAATPGYQFTLDQGLKATQNGYAAQGLGSSGAAEKGAATFATGLADQTYNSQVNNYLNSYNNEFANSQNSYNSQFTNSLNAYNTNFTNTYNAYGQAFNNAYNTYGQQLGAASDLLNLGENAAAKTGQIGQGTASSIGGTLTSGAAAQATGIVGSANVTTNSLNNLANNGLAYSMYGGGGTGAAANPLGITALTGDQIGGVAPAGGLYAGS